MAHLACRREESILVFWGNDVNATPKSQIVGLESERRSAQQYRLASFLFVIFAIQAMLIILQSAASSLAVIGLTRIIKPFEGLLLLYALLPVLRLHELPVLLVCMLYPIGISIYAYGLDGEAAQYNLLEHAKLSFFVLYAWIAFRARLSGRDARWATFTLFAVFGGMAVLVAIGPALGINPSYADQNVRGSFGIFEFSKGVTFVLCAGSVLGVYHVTTRHRNAGSLLFLLCMLGVLVTFTRTGQLGLLVVFGFMLSVASGSSPAAKSARKFVFTLVPVLLVGLIWALQAGYGQDMSNRWEDVIEGSNQIGSGRVLIWQALDTEWGELSLSEMIFGVGYSRMFDVTKDFFLQAYHSHNDIIDLSFSVGLVGVSAYLWWCFGTYRRIRQTDDKVARQLLYALLLAFLVHGVFTGIAYDNFAVQSFVAALVILRSKGAAQGRAE